MNVIAFPNLNLTFTINPIAFTVPLLGVKVHYYGIIIALGLLLALLFVTRTAKRAALDAEAITDMLIFAVPCAIIGARVYYVACKWEDYKDNLIDVIKVWEGGIAIYGAVIAGAAVALIFFRVKHLPPLPYFDVCAFGLLIGQAIGRWGNFVNGEAHGGVTDFILGMSINGGEMVQPTFLYESLWNAVGLLVLYMLYKKSPYNGFNFANYLIWYGTGRFFIEGLRTDSLYIGVLRTSQIVSVIAIALGIALHIIMSKKRVKEA